MTPLNIGVTGNIGSGKSMAARLFVAKGAALIDADGLAREAAEDPAVLRQLATTFGDMLIRDGSLDRSQLAAIVFDNPDARAKLNDIIHPWVKRERDVRVAALAAQVPSPAVIVHDIPLLFEVGLDAEMDKTVVVDAPLEARIARVIERSGLTADEVRARDATQLPLADKVRRADFVLDNSGPPDALTEQVEAVWRELVACP